MKAHLTVNAMGATLVDQEVTYTLEGNEVTLVDLTHYPNEIDPYTTAKVNLVFTIDDDGNLSSAQTIGGAAMGMQFPVDFSSDTMKPVQ